MRQKHSFLTTKSDGPFFYVEPASYENCIINKIQGIRQPLS